MIKSKKQMIIVISIFTLVMLLGTFSYAFFNYTKTGVANRISVGRISFISRQTEIINLTNLFPIDPEESGIMDDATKVGTLEIEIEGDTDYANGVEYLITTVNSTNYTNEGRRIPIGLSVDVTNLGTNSDNYFTARNSKNATLYKRLSGNEIIGNQMLLVGYIKPNTTSGTIEGVNGKITIKAYLDKNKIAITDTYDGLESDLMGTTEEWVDDRVVITTSEWNALQSTGISFKVKVEANEGIWVDEPIYNMIQMNSVMDNINSTYVNNTTPGIDFSNISSDTNGKGIYTRAGTEGDAYPIMYYRGNVDNNNVYFAGKCWQIIRTTETGGTKLIYNGENTGTADAPACGNTRGESRQITLNINGTDTNTFPFSGNNLYASPAYNGYMQGIVYEGINEDYIDGAYFGNNFIYDDTTNTYTLIDTQVGIDKNHHYTCNLTTYSGKCSTIRYYYLYYTKDNVNYYYYYNLIGGKNIEKVLEEMRLNITDSYAKTIIDMWYDGNVKSNLYEDKIEDTIYCNDRSIYTLGGFNPSGGELDNNLKKFSYSTTKRVDYTLNPIFTCLDINDAFTVSSEKGNGQLTYPVSLITTDEIIFAGGHSGTRNNNFYLYTGQSYWTLSPGYFDVNNYAYNKYWLSNSNYIQIDNNRVITKRGLRPVISIKLGTSILSGAGTQSSPYIIK